MEDFLSYFRQRLYYYRPFAHFERVPESYWTNFEKNLPPIVVEWLSWRPVIYTVYLFAILFIVIITYEIVSSLYYTVYPKPKFRSAFPDGRQPSPEISMVSASDVLPAPVPDKVWGKMFGTDIVQDDMQTVPPITEDVGEKASPRKVQRSDAALTQKSPKPASQAQDKCGDCLTKQFKRVEFRWIGKAKKVYLTGNFLKWASMVEMTQVLDGFFVCIDLPKGHYEYKFQVDGKWCLSDDDPTTTSLNGEIINIIHNQ